MSPHAQPSGRAPIVPVDEVRGELRKLGYLDSGLDRFLLAGSGGSPLRASLTVAVRVGLAAGVLFGLIGALAAVGLDRRLLADPRDLAVLTLYLILVSGAGAGTCALLGGLIAAWAARRLDRHPGAGFPRNVGLVAACVGLSYAAFWARSHLSGASIPIGVAALALGLGLSLTLGRFASLAAVAVLAAGGLGDHLPRAGLTRQRLWPLIAFAVAAYGATLAVAAWGARPTQSVDFAVVPTGLRVRVVAIDGLQYDMAEQMVAQGRMPQLATLWANGAHARLRPEPERVPAIVWTTIATGRGPAAHGINAMGSRRLRGLRTPVGIETGDGAFVSALGRAADLLRLTQPQPPSSVLRGAKAFWNVASDKGLRIGIVNWWVTWPAEPTNGYLVTDRAFFRIEKGGAQDREIEPADLLARLAALPRDPGDDRPHAIDRFSASTARALRGDRPPDIEAVYLPGLDILTEQQLGGATPQDLGRLTNQLEGVRAYHGFLDLLLRELVAEPSESDLVVVVGDPGRLARSGTRAVDGLLILAGGPIRGWDLGSATARDVAPTVLHLLGVPTSRELEGRVLEAALRPTFATTHPVRTVDSYGSRPMARTTASAFDREMIEQLRSLGYIQ
jgi:hypothetical protein